MFAVLLSLVVDFCLERAAPSYEARPILPADVGRLNGSWVIDTYTVLLVDGQRVWSFDEVPAGAVVKEIRLGIGRVRQMSFSTKD